MYQTTILRRVREQRILHVVSLELTYQCNLDCFYCYNDREKTGRLLSLQDYRMLLHDLAEMQTLFLMLTGGEPMVHPHFFEIGRMARDLGFVVRVRTNGHSLSRRVAERLKNEVAPYVVEVSLHGATAEVHDRQTRVVGSFERLIKNIRTAQGVGLRCAMITTPTAWNEHQIDAMIALGDSLGIELKFQGPVGPRDNGDTEPLVIQPSTETWARISTLHEQRGGDQAMAHSPHGGHDTGCSTESEERAMCSVGVSGVDIDPFGNVQACVHLQESAGNLHRQSIKDIWDHAPLFQRARARAVAAAEQFIDKPPGQLGAPIYCIAVEENLRKITCGKCSVS